MKLKLNHLRHPVRTANRAKALVVERLNMRRLAVRGERRFGSDARYDLQSVTDGFAARLDNGLDERRTDAALLDRICTAYIKAVRPQHFAPDAYKATLWWEEVRHANLRPVMRALLNHNIDALGRMYRNFFRDACSTGLVGVPYGMTKPYLGVREAHRRLYLIDVLYRVDYWKSRTGGRLPVRDLAGPGIGNPFGVWMEGTLVEAGAEYRHYCAHTVGNLVDTETATVAEIGGGFGGMAYYLLRDRPGVTYANFDVPESLALASYYLVKAFPELKIVLYGEEATSGEAMAHADVALLPLFELAEAPAASVDVTFSSHAISDLSAEAAGVHFNNVARITRRHLLNIGNQRPGQLPVGLVGPPNESFKLSEMRTSEWNGHKLSNAAEVECLYSIDRI
jgi:hypothetical protein